MGEGFIPLILALTMGVASGTYKKMYGTSSARISWILKYAFFLSLIAKVRLPFSRS